MIESQYWKEELERIARSIRRVKKPPRWSERAQCVIERDLMLGFFILRRLIELCKVSSCIRDHTINVFSCLAVGKDVTKLNGHCIWELYDLENEKPVAKKPQYIANQFIHSYTSFVARDETRNWSDIYVVSDYDRKNCIWRVPVEEIHKLLKSAAKDYPHTVTMTYNPKTKDYDTNTN